MYMHFYVRSCTHMIIYPFFPPIQTIKMDDSALYVLDIRVPCVPVAVLSNHEACVDGMAWAPHSPFHICTAGKIYTCVLSEKKF